MHSTRPPNPDLASLLAPTDTGDFFARYWEREPLLITRNNRELYSDLPTSTDFEFMLSSLTEPQGGWFSLVKERGRRPSDAMLTEEGQLNLLEIYDAYRDGYSLLLNQVQKRHRATGLLCRKLEADLSESGVILARHIGANAYLSPSHSQGFSIHYDPHDVFILQLEGCKNWKIYGCHVIFPIHPPTDPISRRAAGRPQKEFLLAPGDLIYIPRGFLHEAHAGGESSLHLTLSVETVTWRDLFSEILSTDPRFREALPRHFIAGALGDGKRRTVATLASALATSEHLGEAFSQVSRRLFANLEAMPNGGLDRVEDYKSLRSDSWVGLADGVFGRVEVSRDRAILHLPGDSLQADRIMAATFRFLLKTSVFRPRDLPVDTVPREKLKFVRGLVLGGYVVRRPRPSNHR
jgi:ribosomal protein L16 Arg81 hydroxylase